MVVDCRSLIEFCRAFEQYRSMTNSLAIPDGGKQSNGTVHTRSTSKRQPNGALASASSASPPLCEKSSAAAVDIVILTLVVGACIFLLIPYFKYFSSEFAEILPLALIFIGEVFSEPVFAYILGAALVVVLVILFWKVVQYKARKCENPKCRGLKKAVEFDIQLESEKCVKSMSGSSLPSPPTTFSHEVPWKGNIELGQDHKELEAELRRMAPPNGRAVLVFRLPCGCPTARMEVWGIKKPRKSKK